MQQIQKKKKKEMLQRKKEIARRVENEEGETDRNIKEEAKDKVQKKTKLAKDDKAAAKKDDDGEAADEEDTDQQCKQGIKKEILLQSLIASPQVKDESLKEMEWVETGDEEDGEEEKDEVRSDTRRPCANRSRTNREIARLWQRPRTETRAATQGAQAIDMASHRRRSLTKGEEREKRRDRIGVSLSPSSDGSGFGVSFHTRLALTKWASGEGSYGQGPLISNGRHGLTFTGTKNLVQLGRQNGNFMKENNGLCGETHLGPHVNQRRPNISELQLRAGAGEKTMINKEEEEEIRQWKTMAYFLKIHWVQELQLTLGSRGFKIWDPGRSLFTSPISSHHLEDKVNFEGGVLMGL